MTPNVMLVDAEAPIVQRPTSHSPGCEQLKPRERCPGCRGVFLCKLDRLLHALRSARQDASPSAESLQPVWDLMDEIAEDGVLPSFPGLAIAQCQREIARQGDYVRSLESRVSRQRDVVEVAIEVASSRAIRTSATFAERFSRLRRAVQRYRDDDAGV